MNNVRRIGALAIVVACVAVGYVSPADAAWRFDDPNGQACFPDAGSDVVTLPPPQAMLMLDRSGSMGSTFDSCSGGTDIQIDSWVCDYEITVNESLCNYDGEYCEEDRVLGIGREQWHDVDRAFTCASCSSDADCVNETDRFMREHVDDEHGDSDEYCGTRNMTASYISSYQIDGNFRCDGCDSDAACVLEAERRATSLFSDFTVDSATYRPGSQQTSTTTKWEIALRSINAVTADMTNSDPDTVQFGAGYFAGGGGVILEEAAPNNRGPIISDLNNESPCGGTPMRSAIDVMRTSATIQNAPGGAAGVLITDGVPTGCRDDVVQAACNHSGEAGLYVVGFGAGTDEGFNDALAAAGGTGSCSNGGDPCAAGGNQYDASYWDGRCTGSYQADNEQALVNALSEIANEISCTFDLSNFGVGSADSYNNPSQGCAADNYECLNISLGGSQRIHYIDHPTETDVGWRFAPATSNSIQILNQADGANDDYCNQIRDGLVNNPTGNDVSIQLACLCTQPTGTACADADFCYRDPQGPNCDNRPGTCDCPTGTWSCTDGLDYCASDSCDPDDLIDNNTGTCSAGVGVCEETGINVCTGEGGSLVCSAAPNNGAAGAEVCDGVDNDCDGDIDEGLGGDLCHVDFAGDHGSSAEQAAIDSERTRCKLGVLSCDSGGNVCNPLSPMPEVCNGLDDDCDASGRIDNLSDSAEPNDQSDLGSYPAASCFQRDVCMCPPDTRDDFEGTTKTEFLEGWANTNSTGEPTCTCGEGLSP